MIWIAVEDRLPEKEGVYLIHAPSADPDKPFIHVAWWSNSNQRWELIAISWANAVTHWMPLPKPPE